MIINVRGTNGAGKTTLVRRIMQCYPRVEPIEGEWTIRDDKKTTKRRKTGIVGHLADGAPHGRKLAILGRYDGPTCGGCDTLPTYDFVMKSIRHHHSMGRDVIYEGMMLSGDYKQAALLFADRLPLHVVDLEIPFEECVASILQRRREAGNTNEFDPSNAKAKYDSMVKCRLKFDIIGLPCHLCRTREEGYQRVKELLGLNSPVEVKA